MMDRRELKLRLMSESDREKRIAGLTRKMNRPYRSPEQKQKLQEQILCLELTGKASGLTARTEAHKVVPTPTDTN